MSESPKHGSGILNRSGGDSEKWGTVRWAVEIVFFLGEEIFSLVGAPYRWGIGFIRRFPRQGQGQGYQNPPTVSRGFWSQPPASGFLGSGAGLKNESEMWGPHGWLTRRRKKNRPTDIEVQCIEEWSERRLLTVHRVNFEGAVGVLDALRSTRFLLSIMERRAGARQEREARVDD